MSEDLWNTVTDGATDLWDDLFGDDEQEQPNDTDMATVDGGENGENYEEISSEELVQILGPQARERNYELEPDCLGKANRACFKDGAKIVINGSCTDCEEGKEEEFIFKGGPYYGSKFSKYLFAEYSRMVNGKKVEPEDIVRVIYSKANPEKPKQIIRTYEKTLTGSHFSNKIRIDYPVDMADHERYNKFQVNGVDLDDGDVMEITTNGELVVTNQPGIPDTEGATVFMNGMNVDQKQFMNYTDSLFAGGRLSNKPVYMIMNLDQGLIEDAASANNNRQGIYAQDDEGLNDVERQNTHVDQNDLESNVEQNDVADEPSIRTLERMLQAGNVKNILSHSQGSVNVAFALGRISRNQEAIANNAAAFEGIQWTSMGGAQSERNIYQLPQGIDLHLTYNEHDRISANADVLSSGLNTPFDDQDRNNTARRIFGEDSYENEADGFDSFTDEAHEYRNYQWSVDRFFDRVRANE
ncbi:MAG: hypothetical protein KDK39_12035 [Leptospiraceae bacterium]|nr:hypothetical protein [Leptospiraceae bacterium]